MYEKKKLMLFTVFKYLFVPEVLKFFFKKMQIRQLMTS